jgi:predicted HTH transcriptional regulator
MPAPSSSARVFFDHILTQPDRFAYLSSLPEPPRYPFFENEWMDFKGAPRNEKDERRIWSKALSGYANTTDGLIVWGIDARKTGTRKIDPACGLNLIPDPDAFESRLRDWIRDTTNPPVMDVKYASISGPAGAGFVVCLIPKSSHRPHRAEFADGHYYYRAGDDFLEAWPDLLRILFYPQYNPQFEIESLVSGRLNSSFPEKLHCRTVGAHRHRAPRTV